MWEEIGEKRVFNILRRHTIATLRTLEQKIADAGPNNQRVEPHVLTTILKRLVRKGSVKRHPEGNSPWYYLPKTPQPTVDMRLQKQLLIWHDFQEISQLKRRGQCLEIAVFGALRDHQHTLDFLGNFPDLDKHDDSTLYSKEEPPRSISGRQLPGNQRLDFLVRHPEVGWAGIECKNLREWMYPGAHRVRELLHKAVALDCVPVMICRRHSYQASNVLSRCGCVLFQTYNQLLPKASQELADRAKHKDLLGYHDIRVGNKPSDRLLKFIGTNLPQVLPKARTKFDRNKELVWRYVDGAVDKDEFSRTLLEQRVSSSGE